MLTTFSSSIQWKVSPDCTTAVQKMDVKQRAYGWEFLSNDWCSAVINLKGKLDILHSGAFLLSAVEFVCGVQRDDMFCYGTVPVEMLLYR